MSDYVIQTKNLSRYFGSKAAVADVNLCVPRGSVYAFMGRNGSGKTTTIRMLLGLLEPTSGSSTVLGQNSLNLTPDLKARIGHLSEGHHLYRWMTVATCGKFQAGCFPKWNWNIFNQVVDYFQLSRSAKVKHLSRGERAGLHLALTLAPEPELLILDDPALGLDPVARRNLLEAMIYVTSLQDRTILFASHLLDDVERVATHVALLDQGVLRVQSSVDVFRGRVKRIALPAGDKRAKTDDIKGFLCSSRSEDETVVTFANFNDDTKAALKQRGCDNYKELPMNLEEAVISFMRTRGELSFLIQE
ncbi:ABC transporter ATP-binding protein [Planctomycetota bacterium]